VTALNHDTRSSKADPYLAGSFVAGDWLTDGASAQRIGPFTHEVVSVARVAAPADIDRALKYAERSAGEVEEWSPAARAAVLEKAATMVEDHKERFARLLALELGKPLKDGRGEMVRVADTLLVAAAEARRLGGEVLPTAGWSRGVGTTALTYRAPVGVVLVITPFPIVHGAIIPCRPVGMLSMSDEGGDDAKIIAVPTDKLTPLYHDIKTYEDLPKITLEQIRHFFELYKALEPGKWVKINGWMGVEAAHTEIMNGLQAYKAK